MSNVITDTAAWLADPDNWSGSTGIPVRLAEHLQYTGLVMLIATAIAVPIGLYVGHTGRGRVAVVALAGALRALPTLGLLTLFVLLAGIGLMPPVWALVILTVPPLLAGTYAGISSVDRNVVDAARAMGMAEHHRKRVGELGPEEHLEFGHAHGRRTTQDRRRVSR